MDLPGPFFCWAALAYPWRHPNWIHWLGLSFMTLLATVVILVSLFVMGVIMRFGAFVSLFFVSTMVLGCLALSSFVVASLVIVIEVTAHGEDRLKGLADINWWETLPRLFYTAGAVAAAAGLSYAVTYPLRRLFPWNSPEILLAQGIVFFQLFPILLITNLVDLSWIPFWSLPATLRRLALCLGPFAAFLILTAMATVAATAPLLVLLQFHWGLALAAWGPIAAAWLMFYGHWLGRLARQLTAAI